VPTDVTRRGDVENLRSQALKEYGHVDVWVNNAGRGITKSVLDLTDRDVDEITAVVLKSVLYGMQAIIPHFQERGRGHLINISSFLGRVPLVSHRSIYSAAKSGVNVLTANARMDLKAKFPGIHKVAKTPQIPRAGSKLGFIIVQSAEEVADQIATLIEHPVAEQYTNPALAGLVSQYCQDVGKFEENLVHRTGSS